MGGMQVQNKFCLAIFHFVVKKIIVFTGVFFLAFNLHAQALSLKTLMQNPWAYQGKWSRVDWQKNSAFVFIPQNFSSPGKKSLMLNLHGCGQTYEQLAKYGNWESTANEKQMIVVVPMAPHGGVVWGCWDYYGSRHDINDDHPKFLFDLTERFLKNEKLEISPSRVYVSGISSGGTMAIVMGCLRPDVYRGIGINSAPALGSGLFDVVVPVVSAKKSSAICKNLAGNFEYGFATQKATVIYGSLDFAINQIYPTINALMFAELYGIPKENRREFSIERLKGHNFSGYGYEYWDLQNRFRVTLIENYYVGHGWFAGNSIDGPYVEGDSLDFPNYLVNFFESP